MYIHSTIQKGESLRVHTSKSIFPYWCMKLETLTTREGAEATYVCMYMYVCMCAQLFNVCTATNMANMARMEKTTCGRTGMVTTRHKFIHTRTGKSSDVSKKCPKWLHASCSSQPSLLTSRLRLLCVFVPTYCANFLSFEASYFYVRLNVESCVCAYINTYIPVFFLINVIACIYGTETMYSYVWFLVHVYLSLAACTYACL